MEKKSIHRFHKIVRKRERDRDYVFYKRRLMSHVYICVCNSTNKISLSFRNFSSFFVPRIKSPNAVV